MARTSKQMIGDMKKRKPLPLKGAKLAPLSASLSLPKLKTWVSPTKGAAIIAKAKRVAAGKKK